MAVKHWVLTPAAIVASSFLVIVRHPSNRGHRVRALQRAVAGWLSYRRTGSPVIAPLGDRSQILVRPRLLSYGESVALYGNPPDYPETTLLRRILQAGDLFVDVGANAGIYTVLAVERGAEVIAVEPGSVARERLHETLELNHCADSVTVLPFAAGRYSGRARFTTGTHVLNRVIHDTSPIPPAGHTLGIARPTGIEEVKVVTLDEIIGDRTAVAVKLDVEGFELDVLEGARTALREHRIGYLQVEHNELSETHYGRSSTPMWQLLRECGYSLYRLDPNGSLVAQPGTPHRGEVVAIAPTSLVWSRLDPSQ
jgi:FkbM family methyltransferase